MNELLKEIREKDNRLIVGIETGNVPGRIGAAVVDVSGRGDETLLDVYSFKSHSLPRELVATIEALGRSGDFDSEELAGINFLLLHHINTLFLDLFDDIEIDPENVDLIGLKCLEIGGRSFPENPSVLSEMTGLVVASHFRIGPESGDGPEIDVNEPILRKMVGEMIDRMGLEKDEGEAVAVALLANEAVWHGSTDPVTGAEKKKSAGKGRTGKRAGKPLLIGGEIAGLYAEFFFPF